MSDCRYGVAPVNLVANPKGRFSHDEAHMLIAHSPRWYTDLNYAKLCHSCSYVPTNDVGLIP